MDHLKTKIRPATSPEDWRDLSILLMGLAQGHILRIRSLLRASKPDAAEAELDRMEAQIVELRLAHTGIR